MKKNIYTAFVLLFFASAFQLSAQDVRGTTAPSAFFGSEEITIYLRVAGSDFEDTEATLSFLSGANGGAMDKTEIATQSEEDGNVWTVTITPDTYYGVTVETIEGKVSDGSAESNTFTLTCFNPTDMEGLMTKVYPEPGIYSENVSVIFNATMSDRDDLSGVEPIYLWAWNNPESIGDAANQGEWGSVDASAACEKIGDNLWRKDLVPQEYWDTKKPMSEFGCLFRNMGGDQQTEDLTVLLVAPPVTEVPAVIRPFPGKFTRGDILSVYYDLKLEENKEMKDVGKMYIETSTNSEEENNPLPGSWISYSSSQLNRAMMVSEGDSTFSIQFIPDAYYSLDPEYDLKQLNFIFRNKAGLVKSAMYSIKVVKED